MSAITALGGRLSDLRWPRPTLRQLLQALAFVAAVAVTKVILVVLSDHNLIKASTPLPVILLGASIGMTYGLLAVGLVLIYRSNRIINFAHGNIGAFGAAFFGVAAVKWHIPYWLAFVLAMIVAGSVGAAAETGAVRRLRKAPLLMSLVVTLGIGQFLVVFSAVVNNTASAGSTYPEPSFMPSFSVGALLVTPAYFSMLVLSPVLVIGLAAFLRYSKFGLGVRAAASNPEAARMAGIFASRMSSLSWILAGAISAFTAILVAPTEGFVSGDSFGPSLILRALVPATLGRLNNLPLALAGGIGFGVIEQLLLWNYSNAGLTQAALFVLVLLILLLQRQRTGRADDKGSWAAVQGLRPLPEPLRRLPSVRLIGPTIAAVFFGVLVLLPLLISNSSSVTFTYFMGVSIVGLSIGILTGLGGQLTLGQFMVAAIGAVASYEVSRRIGDFPLALLYAGLVAGIVSVILGLPALRGRSQLMLAVTTLAFAIAGPAWLLPQGWLLGQGVNPGRPIVFGTALSDGHQYYYFALVLFFLMFILAANIRRSGFARLLIAIRDNEDNARAFAIRASLVKLQGYLIAGFIAGVGGACYAHSLASIGTDTFPVDTSVLIVVMVVLGGVSALSGPIIGCAWIIGLPLLPLGNLGIAATYLGATLVILWRPSGLISLLEQPRRVVVSFLARRHGIDPEPLFAVGVGSQTANDPKAAAMPSEGGPGLRLAEPALVPAQRANGATLLEARALVKHFGGVKAVNGVSFSVRAGETLGLIGPNGAGKTTTFELLGGFTRPDAGRVMFDRRDISHLGPEDRAKLGLIRSFQDAALFPTLTVKECIMLAQERMMQTSFFGSMLGLTLGERRKERRALELIGILGLQPYRDKQIQELSTGTRRIAEIACLVALEPKCLLLDEPSSGIAQRETEALGHLLLELKRQLGLTLVIIEHDIPLIMGISDRIVAMADGEVICAGTPDVVRTDPAVVDAYLGGSITAIERSGTGHTSAPDANGASPAVNGSAPSVSGIDDRLVSVRGLGDVRRARLLTEFTTLGELRAASVDDLCRVQGVGPQLARRIQDAVKTNRSAGV